MPINLNKMSPVPQASYLTAQSYFHYRTIMRIFYLEQEHYNCQLGADEIFTKLAKYDDFNDYTIEQLKLDLSQLCQWKNIIAMQDPRHVNSIEEYKNKQYRYSITEETVLIERMTIALEHRLTESGTLSTNLFSRILEALENVHSILEEDSLMRINEWWRTLQDDFKRLNQNYQDYIRDFYSAKSEKLLKSMEFVLYKDKFITYLRDFVQALQQSSTKIERIFTELGVDNQKRLISRVIESELDIPRAGSELFDGYEEQISEDINSSWQSFSRWFTSVDANPPVSQRVMEYTNEIIRKILSNALLIIQLQNAGISRKDDYKKYLSMFSACDTIDDAHCLCAHVFGAMNTLHFRTNIERGTDSISSTVLDEPPIIFTVASKSKEYRSRVEKAGFPDNTLQKITRRQKYFEQIEAENAMVLRYIKDDELAISSLPENIPSAFRNVLLRWIVLANATSSKTAVTEFGKSFKLMKEQGQVVLHCEDGDLTMPNYHLVFETES